MQAESGVPFVRGPDSKGVPRVLPDSLVMPAMTPLALLSYPQNPKP